MATGTKDNERDKQQGREQGAGQRGGGAHDGGAQKSNMLDLAQKVEAHYTSPSPQAARRAPDFFPRVLDYGLLLGIFLGIGAGLLFALLLHSGRVAPQGWEGLFSLSPFTFYAFWAFAGAALGIVVGGLTTLLMAEPPELPS